MEDIQGNYYTVEYNEDTAGGDYYPVKFEYTKNDVYPLNKTRTVELFYEDRIDHFVKYKPAKIDMDKRLKWIVVKTGGTLLSKYRIDYDYGTSTGRSRITQIQQYGNDGNAPDSGNWLVSCYFTATGSVLPPVEFDWGEDINGTESSKFNFRDDYSEMSLVSRLKGDVNGDGLTDLMFIYSNARIDGSPSMTIKTKLSNGDGTWTSKSAYFRRTVWYSKTLVTGDVNGDGLTDLIYFSPSSSGCRIYTMLSNGDGTWVRKNATVGDSPTDSTDKNIAFTGDVNGDGLSDLIFAYSNLRIITMLSNGDGTWISKSASIYNLPDIWKSGSVVRGDVNGDGLSDLIIAFPSGNYGLGITTVLSRGNGTWTYESASFSYIPVTLKSDSGVFSGDVNGDGLSDLIIAKPSGNRVLPINTFLSNGDSTWTHESDSIYIYGSIRDDNPVFTGDVNGDGLTDLIITYQEGTNYEIMNTRLLSNGDGTWNQESTAIGSSRVVWEYNPAFTDDVNGDGYTDLIFSSTSSRYIFINTTLFQKNPEKIFSIASPSVSYSFEYTPAPQHEGAIQPENSSYPVIADKSPRYMVTRLTSSDGLGNESSVSYEYKNGKFQTGFRSEREDLGFQEIKKTNPNGTYTITTYNQDIPYQGLIKKQETYDSTGNLHTKVEHSYDKTDIYPAQNGYHAVDFIFKTETYTWNYNGEVGPDGTLTTPVETHVEYEYDSYGNRVKVLNHGDTSITEDNTAVFTKYAVNSTGYRMAPYLIRKYGHDLAGNGFDPALISENYDHGLASETKNIFYDDTNSYALAEGQIGTGGLYGKFSISGEADQTKYPDAEITYNNYDNYGNVLSVTDGLGNTGTVSYDDTYHTLVKVKTDAMGNGIETFYDDLMRPVRTRDANNKDWYTKYDVFSRVVSTISPGDNSTCPTTKTEYHDAAVTDGVITSPAYIKSSVKEDSLSNGYINSYTYIDGLGRKIQTKLESVNELGTQIWITTDIYYNQMGKNDFTSIPYESTTYEYTARPGKESQIGVLTEFDDIGRVVKTTNTDTTFSRVFYGKKAVVFVDENNHVTSRYVNGTEVSEMTFDGTYNGSPSWYMDPADNVFYNLAQTKAGIDGTTISYDDALGFPHQIKTDTDMLGRKLHYDDPDMGLWSYTYDANGNIKTQTDAKGQVISFEYDSLNRITKKLDSTSTLAAYLYDGLNPSGVPDGKDHGFCVGRPTTITYSGGSEDYKYDERGRIISLGRTIDGITATVGYEYDSLDRITKEIYPDGEELTYNYNGGGNLSSMENGAAHSYIYNLNYSTLGKVNSFTSGNNTETNYSYYDENGGIDPGSGKQHSFRLKSILVENQTGEDLANTIYQYDKKDNVARKEFTNDFSDHYLELFEYDSLDRLTRAESSSYNSIEIYGTKTYSYDIRNNILTKDGNTYSYDHAGGLSPHAVQSVTGTAGTTDYLYDSNGNMTTKLLNSVLTRTINYNSENRITSISDGGSFTYDSTGERIKKTENGVTSYYFFSTYEEEYEGTDKTVIKYYFANGQRIAKVLKLNAEAPVTVYFHTDHLGSAVMMTDETGNRTMSATYTPYGSDAYYAGVADTKYKFTGQEKDAGSGLYYYGARYYDPELGRFVQPDTILDGLNRYAYCHNNPVKYIDPTGNTADDSDPFGLYDSNPFNDPDLVNWGSDNSESNNSHGPRIGNSSNSNENNTTGNLENGSGETNWTDFFNWKYTESNPNIIPQILSDAGGIEYIEYDHPFYDPLAVLASGLRSLQSQNGRMGGGTLLYREDNGEAALSVRTLFVYRKAGSNDIEYYRLEKTGLSTSNHSSIQGQGKDFTITTAKKSEADKILLGNRHMIIEAINTNPSTLQRIAQTVSSFWARIITSSISY